MKKTISQIVSDRILILDGAMGTMIQQYNLTEEDFRGERFAHIPGQLKGNNDLLCLTRPDVIQDIHRKYLEAGADIIETNTFSSTTVSMADYHVEEYVREINLAAVKLARELADEYTAKNPDKPRFVAGSVGPTNKTCSMSPDVNNPAYRALTYDELAAAYQQQMEAMLEGGVDAILIETIFDKKLFVNSAAANIDISLTGDGTTSDNDMTEGTESVEETETAETETKDSEEETKSTEKDSETTDKSTDKDVTSDYLATLSDLITSLNK